MRRTSIHLSLLVVALACALASPLAAQEARATLAGRVTDSQGAAVPEATVVVVSDDTGVKHQTQTNMQGNWGVQFLLPGRYRFSVTAAGFKTAHRTGITLQVSDNKLIDVQLEVGVVTESVEVTAEAPLIDTTSATSGTVIAENYMAEMPTLSHVPTLFASMSPGVIAQDQNNNIVRMWSVLGASQYLADGGRDVRSNNFQLDGMPNVKSGGYISFIPPMDSLQEFRVQTNAYDATIGRQAGSTMNMATKSGTKDLHGSVYWFNQSNFLNAKLFQTNLANGKLPPVHYNQPGFTAGGPVWIPKLYDGRNKTFFFLSYDLTKNEDPRPGSTRSVPTDMERRGDFSQSFTTQLVGGQLQRFPILVYDPATVDARGNRQLFPNSVIPAARQSGIAQKILAYVPLPNSASSPTGNAIDNFVSAATSVNRHPVISARGDQAWSNSHHSFVTVRWYHLTQTFDNYFDNIATGQYQERIANAYGIDHVWTLSANKILDLRYSVTRFEQPNNDLGAGFDPTQLGFPSRFVSQLTRPSFPRITGFAGNFGTGQAGAYQGNTYHTMSAALSQARGNHTLRYGGEYWILQEANKNVGNQGQFDFSNVWTRQNAIVSGGTGVGSTFASFLLGLPSGGNVPVNANSLYSQRFTAFYFQDDWRVTPRLTLNLGLRWDYERPVIERFNRMTSNFDPNAINPISASAQAAYAQILAGNTSNAAVRQLAQLLPASAFKVPGAQLFAGVGGQPRTAHQGDKSKWQPRFGFAYQLGPNTVIRGGVGRFVQATFEAGGQNGFSRTTSFIHSQDSNVTPYDTLANPFQSGILAPTGSSLGPLTNLGQGVNWINQDPGRPYSWEYSLHLQHQYKGWLFEAGYSHNKTYDIFWGFNQNLPSYELWKQLLTPQFDANGRPPDQLMWNQLVPNPFYRLPNVTGTIANSQQVALNQLLNPIPLLGGITRSDNRWGKNQYDALLVKVEHRFRRGFSVINSFTWSKLLEDTSFWGPEIAGRVAEHKLGGEDRPYHLSIAPIWEVPIGRGKALGRSVPKILDALIGGWQFSGQYNIQSGTPVAFGTDSFFSGQNFSISRNSRSLARWFDTSAFAAFPSRNTDVSNYPAWTGIQNMPGYSFKPAPGDATRNGVYQNFANYVRRYPTRWSNVRASRVNELNFGISKNFRPVERVRIQLRFEAFNALNHPRFGGPDTNPGSANFGRVTPAQLNMARAIQLGAKIVW
ncbi:MAG: TonB-dependent receptor domain-containing protein [Bryobacteraceae bacterium]